VVSFRLAPFFNNPKREDLYDGLHDFVDGRADPRNARPGGRPSGGGDERVCKRHAHCRSNAKGCIVLIGRVWLQKNDLNREDQMIRIRALLSKPRFGLAFTCLVWSVTSVGSPALGLAAEPRSARLHPATGTHDLGVMTYNVDEGSDFTQLANAKNLQQFLIAVGKTITQVRTTDPPARMQALAKEIIAAGPTLVSLQELDQWYSGPFDPATLCGPMTLEFDMLQDLLNALGPAYRLVYQALQYQLPPVPGVIPSTGTFLCVQMRNYIAILAQTGLVSSNVQWSNAQSGQYVNHAFFNTPLGPYPVPHAWVSVDATFNGETFRFIGTHLESGDPNIRQLQGGELRAGPANTSLPVVIAMDSNARAAPPPQDPTYEEFIAAGYVDAWAEIFPQRSGFTCCQAALLNNPGSQLSTRIDLILTSGNVAAENIARFGDTAASKTPQGLWPSDHAGVAAQIGVPAPAKVAAARHQ
jgi:endonuclease/exonuclease/phosphatase family metal-dependent hydrolase